MKTTVNFNLFEKLSSDSADRLLGGFSASYAAINDDDSDGTDDSNNCLGGNCASACGSQQNTGCNTVVGCHG